MTTFTATEKFNWCSWVFNRELTNPVGKKPTRVAAATFPWLDAWLLPHLVLVLQGDLEFEILLGEKIRRAYSSGVQSCMRGRGKDAVRIYGEALAEKGFGVAVIRRGDEIIARAVVRETTKGTVWMCEYGDPALLAVLRVVATRVDGDELLDGVDVTSIKRIREVSYDVEEFTHQWHDWTERSDAWVSSFKKAGGQRYPRAYLTPDGKYVALGGWTNYQTVRVRIPVVRQVWVPGLTDFWVDGHNGT